MDRRDLHKKYLAGIFFLAGILLIFAFIVTIGKDKGFAEPKFRITVLFRNIGGLNEGTPVRLSGVNVGSVDKIKFLEEEIYGRRVQVTMDIFKKFKGQLAKATRIVIQTEGVLGEKLVEVYVIENEPRLDLTNPIIGHDPMEVQDLASVFTRAAESFTKTSDNLSKIDVEELSKTMGDTSEALLTTAQSINAIMAELQDISRKAKRLLDRLEQKVIEGDLFRVF